MRKLTLTLFLPNGEKIIYIEDENCEKFHFHDNGVVEVVMRDSKRRYYGNIGAIMEWKE